MRTTGAPPWLQLGEGERFVQSAGANRFRGRLAAGGWLALTTSRLVHHTHAAERLLTGTEDWLASLGEVAVVDVAPRGPLTRGLFDGSLRSRLRVTTRGGALTLLLVNRVQDWVDAIRSELPR